MSKNIKEPDAVSLTSKEVHNIRNSLNTILGYTQILNDDESATDEQAKMQASIEKAILNIQSHFSNKDEKLINNENTSIKKQKEIKILIVDDHEDNRIILELLLKKYSVKTLHAHNGLESVKIATKEKPDLIFMDLHMPDINGIEASKLIKEKLPDIDIIALSGDIDAIENEALYSSLFKSYVSKPFNRDEVRDIVKNFLTLQSESSQKNKIQIEQLNHNSQFIPQKILIVDDKPENLSLFKDILAPYNYEINVATNGVEALDIVSNFNPELILLDVVMPNMNGFEVLKELKKDKLTSEIPVIFLTANDTTDDIVNGFEAGVVDYIAKPFHPRELIARVDTHLKKAKLLANIKRLMEHSFHELYTPLTVVRSAMQMQELESKKTDYTQMTLAACKTLQNIYDELYYSINYSTSIKHKTIFNLSTLLNQRIGYFSLVAQSRSLEFETELPKKMLIEFNQEDMERMLDNIISNALKYTRENNKIKISLNCNNGVCNFSICNPISKKIDVEKIFQKYYRHEDEMFGLGLGLELVQSICKKNNIDIRATANDKSFCIRMELKQTL